jgi:hypothetical protein
LLDKKFTSARVDLNQVVVVRRLNFGLVGLETNACACVCPRVVLVNDFEPSEQPALGDAGRLRPRSFARVVGWHHRSGA